MTEMDATAKAELAALFGRLEELEPQLDAARSRYFHFQTLVDQTLTELLDKAKAAGVKT
jgi:hypothetical protein